MFFYVPDVYGGLHGERGAWQDDEDVLVYDGAEDVQVYADDVQDDDGAFCVLLLI